MLARASHLCTRGRRPENLEDKRLPHGLSGCTFRLRMRKAGDLPWSLDDTQQSNGRTPSAKRAFPLALTPASRVGPVGPKGRRDTNSAILLLILLMHLSTMLKNGNR